MTETPGRLDYLDALSVLTQASAIVLLGSSEPHYTASKLYPALLARRPVLALFHEASSVVSILRSTASEPTVRVVAYGSENALDSRVGEVACHLARSRRAAPTIQPTCRWTQAEACLGAQPGAPARRRLRSGGRMTTPVRLTAVLTHPIQYYAPWFRHIHAHAPGIALTVVYATQPNAEQQGVGFDRSFEWDVPLVDGYRSITVRRAQSGDRIDTATSWVSTCRGSATRSLDTEPGRGDDRRLVLDQPRPRAPDVPAASASRRSIAAIRTC